MPDRTNAPIVIRDSDCVPEEVVPVPAPVSAPIVVQTEVSSPEEPIVIEAPVAHGRSFMLRHFFNGQTQIGQMLVLVHRDMCDAAIEVLETYLPVLEPGKTFGRNQNRFYLGDRKIPNEFLPLIFEMKVSHNKAGKKLFEYRLLQPTGKVYLGWGPLNLAVLKLKTTEEQRALISAFTGIIYKIRQTEPIKQTNQAGNRSRPKYPPRQPRMGGIFERAGVSVGTVKHKIQAKKSDAPIRGDIQRGLPPKAVPSAVPSAGPGPVEPAAPEAGPVAETSPEPGVAPDGV